jgi:hypothetical protein
VERDDGHIPATPAGKRVIDTLMLIRDETVTGASDRAHRTGWANDRVQRESALVGRLACRAIVNTGDVTVDTPIERQTEPSELLVGPSSRSASAR